MELSIVYYVVRVQSLRRHFGEVNLHSHGALHSAVLVVQIITDVGARGALLIAYR